MKTSSSKLEKILVSHCAPTLAGIKTGSLVNFCVSDPGECMEEFDAASLKLNEKGVKLEILRMKNDNLLILMYRPGALKNDLKQCGMEDFLHERGYKTVSPEEAVLHLKKRFAGCEGFPHEIGLFLGYPLDDVIGFIENGGKNCRFSGCWKVYRNEAEALRRFARYRKCRAVYLKLFRGGCSITRLAVAG